MIFLLNKNSELCKIHVSPIRCREIKNITRVYDNSFVYYLKNFKQQKQNKASLRGNEY